MLALTTARLRVNLPAVLGVDSGGLAVEVGVASPFVDDVVAIDGANAPSGGGDNMGFPVVVSFVTESGVVSPVGSVVEMGSEVPCCGGDRRGLPPQATAAFVVGIGLSMKGGGEVIIVISTKRKIGREKRVEFALFVGDHKMNALCRSSFLSPCARKNSEKMNWLEASIYCKLLPIVK